MAVALTLLWGTAARAQLPAGWQDLDIGSPGQAGSAAFANGTWTVSGGGTDIANTSDQFNFAFATSSSSAVLIAQVLSVEDTAGWAKAGVMFRDDTTPGAMFAMVVATPNDGVDFCFRNATGAVSSYAEIAGPVAPVWVQLQRSGNTFTAAYSPDGVTWTAVGPAVVVPMSSQPLAGLAVTADNNSALCQATFSSVVVSNVPPPPPPSLGVYRQLWINLNESIGNTLAMLTNTAYNPNWPNNPDPDLHHDPPELPNRCQHRHELLRPALAGLPGAAAGWQLHVLDLER